MKKGFVFFIFFLFVPLTFARYKMGVKKPVKTDSSSQISKTQKPKAPTKAPSGKVNETEVLSHLSQKYQVEMSQLEYFRKLKYGYEELVPSLVVAKTANVEVGQILSHRDRGKSWKDISDTFGVELKPLNKTVIEELKPIKKILPKALIKERPAYFNGQ